MQIDDYIAVTKAKAKLLDIIRNVNDQDDTIAITKNGIPRAVMMSMEHYEALRETMAVIADKDIMKQIQLSATDIRDKKSLIDLMDLH